MFREKKTNVEMEILKDQNENGKPLESTCTGVSYIIINILDHLCIVIQKTIWRNPMQSTTHLTTKRYFHD